MICLSMKRIIAAAVAAALLVGGSAAIAEEEVPPPALDDDDIVLPVGLPDDEPYVEDPALADSGDAPRPELVEGLENTPALCGDGLDNDQDNRVDCDDQDCELFAACVEPAPRAQAPIVAAPRPTPKPSKPRPRPDVEGPRKPRLSPEARSKIRRLRGLRIVGHATFWPGLAITLGSAMAIGMDGEACGSDDFMGMCYGVWIGIGSALLLTGLITGTTYRVKRGQYLRQYAFVAAPVVAEGFGGIAGVGWF